MRVSCSITPACIPFQYDGDTHQCNAPSQVLSITKSLKYGTIQLVPCLSVNEVRKCLGDNIFGTDPDSEQKTKPLQDGLSRHSRHGMSPGQFVGWADASSPNATASQTPSVVPEQGGLT